jgi:anti-anti-sigma regulatory factor
MPSIRWLSPMIAVVELDAVHTLATDDFAAVRGLLLDLAGRCDRLIVDLSSTRMLDGAFLGVLAATWTRMGRRRSGFMLCGLDEHKAHLLRICHLDRVWMIAPTHRAILGHPGR